MDETFIREIDQAAVIAGHGNRSQFIRDAIHEKLASMGIEIPPAMKAAPLRGASSVRVDPVAQIVQDAFRKAKRKR